jgi:hypothetical protein
MAEHQQGIADDIRLVYDGSKRFQQERVRVKFRQLFSFLRSSASEITRTTGAATAAGQQCAQMINHMSLKREGTIKREWRGRSKTTK